MEQITERASLSGMLADLEVRPYFQPIICLKTGRVFAYEALIRGWTKDTRVPVSPEELFALTDSLRLTREFDSLCQRLSLEVFGKFDSDSDSLLFLNVHTKCIFRETVDEGQLPTMTLEMGFHPESIGLELIESKANSANELIYFVSQQRERGFLIVVDDFGTEHSNIERLILIHPDVIKIDRNIISGIDKDTYRQSILKSIVNLSEMTGSLCLAEGVENDEELLTCALLGVNLLQGFAIAKPGADLAVLKKQALAKIDRIHAELHKRIVSHLKETKYLSGYVDSVADWFLRQLDVTASTVDSMEMMFQEFLIVNPEIENIFMLDENGIQVSNMVVAPHVQTKSPSIIFQTTKKGCNHSLRPYFTCFRAFKVSRFFTDRHLSSVSGNLCRTLSIRLEPEEAARILCIDFLVEEVKTPLLSK